MMKDKVGVVVGATGDVGRGVVMELLRSGANVIAVSRHADKLESLKSELSSLGALQVVPGSLATEQEASELGRQLASAAPSIDVMVVSVNAARAPKPLAETQAEDFLAVLNANLITQFIGLKVLQPLITAGGTYLSIGGGMADWVVPGFGTMSACQAAQRAMLKAFVAEQGESPTVRVRELMLHSMIAGLSKKDQAQPSWLTDEEVGRHVLTILENPDAFPEPVINLKSRKQVGQLPAPIAAQ